MMQPLRRGKMYLQLHTVTLVFQSLIKHTRKDLEQSSLGHNYSTHSNGIYLYTIFLGRFA